MSGVNPHVFSDEQHDEILNQCMDLATNIRRMRQVVILTLDLDGNLNTVQKRVDSATTIELIGIYELMAADLRRNLMGEWRAVPNPNREDDED